MGATAAIAGLGITEMGKVYGRTATDFAAEAIALALDDAGLRGRDVDGLLINANHSAEMAPTLQLSLGLDGPHARQRDERLRLDAPGRCCSTPRTRSQTRAGERRRLRLRRRAADARAARSRSRPTAASALDRRRASPACASPTATTGRRTRATRWRCRRHMHLFGTTHDQLGTIAVGQRAWAQLNPRAQMRKPMTLDDYHASRWVVEPLHLLRLLPGLERRRRGDRDVGRARARPAPAAGLPARLRPVRARATPARPSASRRSTPAPTRSGELALRQAGIALADVDVLELYDCYTYTVLVTLEDYGFCAKGEGGAFVADGKLGPGGSLPLQHRRRPALLVLHVGLHAALGGRDPGARPGRRAPGRRKHDLVLVTGNGGALNFHSTTILSTHEARARDDDDRRAGQAGPDPRRGEPRRSSTARRGAC